MNKCPECETTVKHDYKYCGECGYSLNKVPYEDLEEQNKILKDLTISQANEIKELKIRNKEKLKNIQTLMESCAVYRKNIDKYEERINSIAIYFNKAFDLLDIE